MTIFRKKLLLLLLALLASVSLGLGLLFMPAKKSSAAEVVLNSAEHFNISSSGVFGGLSDAGKEAIGTGNFSVELPDNVKSIAANALSGNPKLISVKVPSSVTLIGAGAFSNCIYLAEVEIPNIVSISDNLFQGCYRLEKLNANANGKFNIPESVTTIGDNAFNSCIAIQKLTIPAGVTQIGSNAFYGLDGATVINYLAKDAGLTGQTSPFLLGETGYGISKVTVNIGDSAHPVNTLPTGLFSGHRAVREINFTNLKLTDGETDFGLNVFSNCTALTKVTFDEGCSVPVINTNAFSGCTSLHSVIGLEKIGLRTIGQNAFYGCRSLNTVSIGAEVTMINQGAFSGCERLIEVKNLSAITIEKGKLGEKDGGVALHAEHVYGAGGESWISEDANGFVFYADTTDTNNPVIQLLGYTGSLANVTLPSAYVKGGKSYTKYSIYKYAFVGNTAMQKLHLPVSVPNVVVIGAYAFAECTSLTEIDLPAGVNEIATGAFANCSALEDVDFNGNDIMSKIDSYVFQNCTSLASIKLPKSIININSYAFSGCSKLAIVDFTPTDNKTKTYSLKTVEDHAFAKCSSLSAIEIPVSVEKIGANCFEECTNLQFVYLPSNGTNRNVTYGTDVFKSCHDRLVLISAGKAQYTKDKDENLKGNASSGTLTYLVTVELIYQDGCLDGIHTIQKLYKMPGDLEQTDNGLNWVSTSRMPRQGHDDLQKYAISKWFETLSGSDDYQNEVTLEKFTTMLAQDNSGTITLYARYFTHPKLGVTGHLQYADNAKYTIGDILKSRIFREDGEVIDDSRAGQLVNNFSITIISHTLTDGSEDAWVWATGKEITEAGTYVMQVTLPTDGSYGVWMDNYTIDFTIDPGEKNINDLIKWKTAGGILAPTEGLEKLYFFDGQSTPYLTPQVKGYDEKGSPIYQDSTIEVLTSYTVYSGSKITVELDMTDLGTYIEAIGADDYINNSGVDAGTYVAQVTLKPLNNYTFTYSTTDNIKRRGLRFELQSDGTIIVYKTWYIAISDVNQLLSNDGSGLFEIPAKWTYMDGSQIPLQPSLSKLDEKASQILSFTLEFTDTQGKTVNLSDLYPDGRISISAYPSFMNSSMPAGNYKITFYIAAAADDSGTMITGDPAGKTFNFTVSPITITNNDRTGVTSRLTDFNARSEDLKSGDVVFASTAGIPLFDKPQADNSFGAWANYPQYYTPFAIRYRVERVGVENSDPDYYTEEEYKNGGSDMIKPQAIGSYIIHYIIEAPNYGGRVVGSYNLNITYTLSPELPDFAYQNANVLNSVIAELKSAVSDDLNYFDIYTMLDYSKLDPADSLNRETYSASMTLRGKYPYNNKTDDEYKEVNKHNIFLKIKDVYSAYILWDTTTGKYDSITKFYILPFDIVAADNSEKVALSVKEWEYGRFSESVNKPVWELVFGDDTNYKFTLQLKSDSTVEYYYYTNAKSNEVLATQHKTFNDAPAGEYILFAEDKGDTEIGFKAYKSQGIEVRVHKVNIYFEEAPYVPGWTYGTLTATTDVLLSYTLGADLDKSIAEDIEVKYVKAEDYKTKKPGSLSEITKNGYVPAGDYYLVLVRKESENVAELSYAVKFSVLQAQNYWETAPSLNSWTYGEFSKDKLPTKASFVPHFGNEDSIRIEYKAPDRDTWVEDISELLRNNQLPVGQYQMRVRLLSSSDDQKNFTTLDTVIVTFNVYAVGSNGGSTGNVPGSVNGSDGDVSNGAVIGAIIVFAVIAVAVVVAFVVIKVIANKKANAEYIKTVKSEMKRR